MKKTTFVLLCLWTVFLFSCATTSVPKEQRFQALEDAILEGDLAAAKALIKADKSLLKQHTEIESMEAYDGSENYIYQATPLQMAIINQDAPMVQLFLEYGADPKLTDEDGWDSIVYAAAYGTPEIIDMLVDHDPTLLNYRTYSFDTTILHNAASMGTLDTVRHLVETYGLDTTTPDVDGETPVDYAYWNNDEAVYQYFEAVAPRVSAEDLPPLYQAIINQDLEQIQACIKENPDSLHQQADVILEDILFSGITPLQMALLQQDSDIVRLLLDSGADPRQTDNDDADAALYAAASGDIECIKALVQSDPYIFTYRTYEYNATPLHIAAIMCSRETIEYLVTECGADPTAEDMDGDTPADYAEMSFNLEVAEYLSSLE